MVKNAGSSGSQFVRWYSGSTARVQFWEAALRMKDIALAWLDSAARGWVELECDFEVDMNDSYAISSEVTGQTLYASHL